MSIGSVDLRFWRKVQRCGKENCWPWLGAKTKYGYGRFKIAGDVFSAHRVAYVLANNELPPQDRWSYHGTVVRHTCDNPSCCNPAHLEVGTQEDNVRDMMDRGRHRYARSSTVAAPGE